MTATKTIIQNSLNKTRIKFTATAASDTITINLKKTVTLASVGTSLTFVAGDNGTGKIVRQAGSWATDFASAPGNKFVTVAGAAIATNNRTYSVLSVSTTSNANDTITVLEMTKAEVATGATATSYESDVAMPGQTIATPLVNISGVQHTLGGSCTVVRNSVTVAVLFGTWLTLNDQSFGFNEQNGSDIVLATVTAGGTVVIDLAKVSGFNAAYQYRDV
jgi:hypothetical protein